jgi:hypothetical protein
MTDYFETKSQPISSFSVDGYNQKVVSLPCDHQQEEPDELRGSCPVLWESGGAIPLPDPIGGNFKMTKQQNKNEDI